jgi:glycosyltransferase involved in cell wall biosynthesis
LLKHICMVVSTDFWNDRRVYKEATSVLELGYQLTLICTKRPEDKIFASSVYQKKLLEVYDDRLVVRVVNLGERKYRKVPIFSFIYALFWICRGWIKMFVEVFRVKADLFHFHDIDTLAIGIIPAKYMRKPIVFDCHDIFSEIQVKDSVLYKMRAIWGTLERTLAKKADAVFTIASSVEKYLSERCGVAPSKITKVYNAPLIYPKQEFNSIREEHNLSENVKIVLYLGSVNPDRGLDTLFQSATYFSENLVLAVYGFGHEDTWKELRRLARKYGVENKVVFGGAVEANKVHQYLMSSDFLTIPNVFLSAAYDVLPNKFFECMMAGKPFVCNELPEMAVLVREYNCGIVCNNDSPKSYANALNDLLSNPAHATLLGQNGREKAENIHNWNSQAYKISGVYAGLLEEL